MVLLIVLATVVGGIALGGTAAALDGSAAAVYPATPGTDTLGTFVFVVRPGDNVAQNGIKHIKLDFGPGAGIANVSDKDIFISVRGGQRIEISEEPSSITEVNRLNVSTNTAKNIVTITLPRPVRPRVGNVGAEVAIKVENFTTPSQPGTYTVQGTFIGPQGKADGPATVSYWVSSPALSMANQSVSQFDSNQTINVSASIPGGGYVALFTVGENGSPDSLIGWTNVTTAPSVRNYTVSVGENVTKSQRIVAIAYTESMGRSSGLRAEQSFDPVADEPLVVNGAVVNATAFVSTLDVDARVMAGKAYDQGTQLYFAQGQPNTAYQIHLVKNGTLGPTAAQFQTRANGTAIINTSQLGEGRYAITRVADGSLVSLDTDSTTGPVDDSFVITGQQATPTGTPTSDGSGATNTSNTTSTTSVSNATTSVSTATTDGGGAGTTATDGTSADGAADGGSGANESGSGEQATEAGGPGFGIAVAVLALLGAALLATRRH